MTKDFLYLDKKAVYPGSFDPVTLGHLDVIQRATFIFDKVIVLVLNNYRKKPLFTLKERAEMIKKSIENTDFEKKVLVDIHDGLLIDYLKNNNIKFVVKGIRAISDFEYEFQQYLVNSKLMDIETIFFMTKLEYNFLSSSLVKEVAFFGGDISAFVPQSILKDIINKIDNFKMGV